MKSKIEKIIKVFGLILSLLCVQFNLIAQEKKDFIAIKDIEPLSINANKIDKLKKNPVNKKIQTVTIGAIKDYIDNGDLTFNIPGKKGKFKAHVKEFRYISDKNFVWKGHLKDQFGDITIICENGKIFGYIAVDNQYFEIQDVDGESIFIEVDTTIPAECVHIESDKPKTDSGRQKSSIESSTSILTTTTGNIRILVLYTDAAKASVANIFNTATLAVSQLNDAFRSSGITSSQLSATLAGTEYLNFTENSAGWNNINLDLSKLGENPQAQQLRTLYQADIVVLLTGSSYGTIAGTSSSGPATYSWEAYVIVTAPAATTSYTFTHEVGHQFGCLHEVEDESWGTYEHAYKFTSGQFIWKKYWKTVMHTIFTDGEYVKILAFSNPDVDHWNNPTGNANANNARKLLVERFAVENLRPYTPAPSSPSVYISGPTKGDNNGYYTWSAIGSGGTPPYTYLWQYSLDGINYNSTLGTTQSVSASLPLDNDLYLKVIITDSKQSQATDFFLTINMGGGVIPEAIATTYKSTGTSSAPISLTVNNYANETKEMPLRQLVYPNPAQNITTVQYVSEHSGTVQILIINSLGAIIRSYEIIHQFPGIYSKTIQVDRLENGIYFIRVISDGKQEIHTLVVNR